jgi:hypothetical protein
LAAALRAFQRLFMLLVKAFEQAWSPIVWVVN